MNWLRNKFGDKLPARPQSWSDVSTHFMTTKTTYILTILILTYGLISCGQNTASQEPIKNKSNFSISITTYNHAEQIFNGITTYDLINDTLKIHKSFMFSDKDTILLSKKIDDNSIEQIKSIRIDSLKDFYFNNCIMATSGNEYFILTTIDTVIKKISLHHYYDKQIERLINELNKNIPDNLKLDYLTSETKQDCE